MSDLEAARAHFVSRFASYAAELQQTDPAWLASLRNTAIERFAQLGFPTRKWETWKYTNAEPIAKASLDPAPRATCSVSRDDIQNLFGAEAAEHCLVFENGSFAPQLSSENTRTDSVLVRSLAAVLAEDPDSLRPFLDRRIDALSCPFVALNHAFQRDGALIQIAAGASLAHPIHLLFVITPEGARRATHPHNIIAIEGGAKAALVFHYASLTDEVYWTNAVTRVSVGANAQLDLVTIQAEGDRAFHLGALDVSQERDSQFRSHLISLGSALCRTEVKTLLGEPGADCTLNGLFLADGEQHVDNQTAIDHASLHGTSRELYKGILAGRSRGVFNGLITVRPGAQKTNASQSNRNLLTSDHAHVNTKPTLEIYANDVKCTHGSTVGQLDEDALFYLRARGLGERAARKILTRAFASEIADAIPYPSLSEQVQQLVERKLEVECRPDQEAA